MTKALPLRFCPVCQVAGLCAHNKALARDLAILHAHRRREDMVWAARRAVEDRPRGIG